MVEAAGRGANGPLCLNGTRMQGAMPTWSGRSTGTAPRRGRQQAFDCFLAGCERGEGRRRFD